jgi:hypothetical protein
MEPRVLTPEEITLLKLLLPDGAFPDVDIYRQQAEHLTVTGKCRCGCPTVDFTVDTFQAPQAAFSGNPAPLPIEAEAGEGENYVQVILFARHGWLELLELVYFTEHTPVTFPDPADLRLITCQPKTET